MILALERAAGRWVAPLRCARPRPEESLLAEEGESQANAGPLAAEQLWEARAEQLAWPREPAPALRALRAEVQPAWLQKVRRALEAFVVTL